MLECTVLCEGTIGLFSWSGLDLSVSVEGNFNPCNNILDNSVLSKKQFDPLRYHGHVVVKISIYLSI